MELCVLSQCFHEKLRIILDGDGKGWEFVEPWFLTGQGHRGLHFQLPMVVPL